MTPLAAKRVKRDDEGMDVNTLAYKIVQQSIGEKPAKVEKPAAKRGHARAAALTPARRSEIAKKSANDRWKASKNVQGG